VAVSINEAHNSEHILRSLAAELKHPLYLIARYAELQDTENLKSILDIAEGALSLIDDFLLVARAEYGQVQFDLEPIGTGSILADAANKMRPLAAGTEMLIKNDVHEPVMTHQAAILSGLVSCAQVMNEVQAGNNKYKSLVFRGFKTAEGRSGIGVFGPSPISAHDVRRALSLRGRAHMPLAKISQKGATSLAIADGLFRAVGGTLEVRKMDNLKGLSTLLPKSEQLALI
jgi:hypothetical protein